MRDQNIDANVILEDGRQFGVTFFTPENIRYLLDRNQESYFWSVDMVIIPAWSLKSMFYAVDELLKSNTLEKFCQEVPSVDLSQILNSGLHEVFSSKDFDS